MLAEIIKGIVTQYNTLQYNGSDLSDTAPIYFGTAPDGKPYPFTSFYLVDTQVDFDTCNDYYDSVIQFSVFDNSKSPENVLLIGDAINDGFNNASLSGLDGIQLRMEPISQTVQQLEDAAGHVCILNYKLVIEKAR